MKFTNSFDLEQHHISANPGSRSHDSGAGYASRSMTSARLDDFLILGSKSKYISRDPNTS